MRPLSSDEEEELGKLQAAYGDLRLSWHRVSARDRLELVKQRWGEETADEVDFVYELIQRQNNTLLHGSPKSLGHGILGYYVVCRVLAEELGLDKDPTAEVFERASCLAD